MHNPYAPPSVHLAREFNQLRAKCWTGAVMLLPWIAWAFFPMGRDGSVTSGSVFEFIVRFALVFCIWFELITISWLISVKKKYDRYLHAHPVVDSKQALFELKVLLRIACKGAVYLHLVQSISIFFALIVVTRHDGMGVAIILGILLFRIFYMKHYLVVTEDKIKYIACTNPDLEDEVERVVHDFVEKFFPRI